MWRDPALHPLSHQHQHGLALCVLIDRGLKKNSSSATVRDLTAKALAAWEVEIDGHFRVEEEDLFPEVRAVIEEPGLVDELVAEHRRIEELVARLQMAPSAERLRELGQALSAHIRTEERRLFEQIQAALSVDAMAALGVRLDAAVEKTCPLTAGLPWEEA